MKAVIAYAVFIGYKTTFYQISSKIQGTKFLDKKIKSKLISDRQPFEPLFIGTSV
jgi:hypothetical protein